MQSFTIRNQDRCRYDTYGLIGQALAADGRNIERFHIDLRDQELEESCQGPLGELCNLSNLKQLTKTPNTAMYPAQYARYATAGGKSFSLGHGPASFVELAESLKELTILKSIWILVRPLDECIMRLLEYPQHLRLRTFHLEQSAIATEQVKHLGWDVVVGKVTGGMKQLRGITLRRATT